MIGALIDLCTRNRLAVLLVTALLVAWGGWALRHTPLDAIPDLGDTQVIVYTEWTGRSPDLVEDQVTYPLVTTLLSAPGVQVVRGFSFLGSSFIYAIFEDGRDIYWARSRVLEYLQAARRKLPPGVEPVLGPDASGVGWGFSYALVDETGTRDLAALRSLQDWKVKLALESVPGVAEVASVGGFVKQYQVEVQPQKLAAFGIPLSRVVEAVRRSNRDVAGRVIEFSEIEYMIRGRGYLRSLDDLRQVPLGTGPTGAPVRVGDVARVQSGPQMRRGLTDLDGKGEVVGGIVVVRYGENVLDVIERVKERISTGVEPTLPPGVKVAVTYDRADLIGRAVRTLAREIFTLSLAVGAVCLVFLFHLPSALVIILTLPVAIVVSFILMHYLGVTANIMSLGGIAIAIGAMVDAAIVMVENAHKRLEEWESRGRPGPRTAVIVAAAREVGPSLFFSLLVITAGFLPVFGLQDKSGRLFRPLAYTKTFAMLFSSFIAVTLTPVLMTALLRGGFRPEERNPVGRVLRRAYAPVVDFSLRHRWKVVFAAVVLVAVTVFPYRRLGGEFMPPLYEGSLMYMPVTMPGSSITTVEKILGLQDRLLMRIPEVASVFGKAGRAETATDPAPLEMYETVINLKPEAEWRPGMTVDRLVEEMDAALRITGVVNSFTMPIKARIDMLSTGIRTPLGIKVKGPDLAIVEEIALRLEGLLNELPGARSVYAERVNSGYFLDLTLKREEAARYGLAAEDVNAVIEAALGGSTVTTTVEGRERYPVNVRYPRELRRSREDLERIYVPVGLAAGGAGAVAQVPLGQVADVSVTRGPAVVKTEEGTPVSYVYIDPEGRDIEGYVSTARELVDTVPLPPGYRVEWSGEWEHLVAARGRLKVLVPFTVLVIVVLLYLGTGSLVKTAIVLLAVPFSLVGSFWLLYLLGYHLSVAVWIGLIALAGLDAETGVVMLLYLDLAWRRRVDAGVMRTADDLREAVREGAVKRLRPKVMTVSVILAGLVPIMFSHGIGADVMKRIAAPMIGGVVTSAILELAIYPALFALWRGRALARETAPAGEV